MPRVQTEPTIGGSSPWDTVQYLTQLAPGIVSVGTAGHGGIWISAEREASIPADVRQIARQYAPIQWYEEDCDCCIPYLWFEDEIAANWDHSDGKTADEFFTVIRAYVAGNRRMAPLHAALTARKVMS